MHEARDSKYYIFRRDNDSPKKIRNISKLFTNPCKLFFTCKNVQCDKNLEILKFISSTLSYTSHVSNTVVNYDKKIHTHISKQMMMLKYAEIKKNDKNIIFEQYQIISGVH